MVAPGPCYTDDLGSYVVVQIERESWKLGTQLAVLEVVLDAAVMNEPRGPRFELVAAKGSQSPVESW